MYLIGIRNNAHPCGNAGTLISRYKAEYKIREIAQRFAAIHSLDEVYRLNIYPYPQKLCEMNNAEFTEHIRRTCKRYV